MAQPAVGATIGALAKALEELGLEELEARRVAADWAAHYPLVSRAGAPRVARSMEGLGLGRDASFEAAGLMLALELQVRGAPYQAALRRVEREGVPGSIARAATLEAVQLRRAAAAPEAAASPRVANPLGMIPIGVGAAALVLARLFL